MSFSSLKTHNSYSQLFEKSLVICCCDSSGLNVEVDSNEDTRPPVDARETDNPDETLYTQLDKLDVTNAEHPAIHVNELFAVSGNDLSDAPQPHEILYNIKIHEDETFLDNHQNDLSHLANLLAIPWSSDDGHAYPSAEVSYTSTDKLKQSELVSTRPLTECCTNYSLHSTTLGHA